MAMRIFTSREFLRHPAAVKRAALEGPVCITDRGKPCFVLQTVNSYYARQGGNEKSFLTLMDGIDGGGSFDFEPAKLDDANLNISDFS